jgi:hypothetical protein
MRIIAIIGALLFGIVGLLMSVCGGGFFVTFCYSFVTSLPQSVGSRDAFGMLPVLALAAGCAVGGGFLAWYCFRHAHKRLTERARNERSPEDSGAGR